MTALLVEFKGQGMNRVLLKPLAADVTSAFLVTAVATIEPLGSGVDAARTVLLAPRPLPPEGGGGLGRHLCGGGRLAETPRRAIRTMNNLIAKGLIFYNVIAVRPSAPIKRRTGQGMHPERIP